MIQSLMFWGDLFDATSRGQNKTRAAIALLLFSCLFVPRNLKTASKQHKDSLQEFDRSLPVACVNSKGFGHFEGPPLEMQLDSVVLKL